MKLDFLAARQVVCWKALSFTGELYFLFYQYMARSNGADEGRQMYSTGSVLPCPSPKGGGHILDQWYLFGNKYNVN